MDRKKYEGHAPSPWRRDEGQPYDDEASHLDIVDANGALVTETSYFTDSDVPNIQLIIDAPELLAMLNELLEECRMHYWCYESENDDDVCARCGGNNEHKEWCDL